MITAPRKPVVRLVNTPDAPHGVQKRMVLSICPSSGTITLREHGRRSPSSVTLSLSCLYVQGLRSKIVSKRKGKGSR